MKKSHCLLILMITCAGQFAIAQDRTTDWNLIMGSGKPADKPRHRLNVYRAVIKPQLPSSCNFELTCSSFGTAMIMRYGLPKGYFLTVDRWIRDSKISVYETYPIRLTLQRKIKESPDDFHLAKKMEE